MTWQNCQYIDLYWACLVGVIAVGSLINGLNDYVAGGISSNLSADVFMIKPGALDHNRC